MTYHLYVDGAARGNPGPAAIGVVVFDEGGQEVAVVSEKIENTTNNVAEYQALIAGLAKANELEAKNLVCHMDSELVVKQVKGEYKCKKAHLKPLLEEVQQRVGQFQSFELKHVRRHLNQRADELANEALDQ